VLSRRIQDLQNSRVEFARMIKELNVIILKAEANVSELQNLSHQTTEELQNSINDAKHSIDELKIVNGLGLDLTKKLSTQISTLNNKPVDVRSGVNNSESSYFSDDDFLDCDVSNNSEKVNSINKYSAASVQNKSIGAGVFSGIFSQIINKGPKVGQDFAAKSYYDTLRKINNTQK
jgi:chromosome segregation ATPase